MWPVYLIDTQWSSGIFRKCKKRRCLTYWYKGVKKVIAYDCGLKNPMVYYEIGAHFQQIFCSLQSHLKVTIRTFKKTFAIYMNKSQVSSQFSNLNVVIESFVYTEASHGRRKFSPNRLDFMASITVEMEQFEIKKLVAITQIWYLYSLQEPCPTLLHSMWEGRDRDGQALMRKNIPFSQDNRVDQGLREDWTFIHPI